MDISASAVASLRARTGVSILACKEALTEANGDEEKAIEILRKRGLSQAAKKADRDQKEGLVFVKESAGKAAIVLIRCETDFVARDTNFQDAGKAIAEEAFNNGEAAGKTLSEKLLPELVQKLGENITLGNIYVAEGKVMGTYLHSNAKIGVIVGLDGGTVEHARDTAMHAAAFAPGVVSPNEVTEDSVTKEKEIWAAQLAKEGKPAPIMEKIMQGKEKKFREENALLTQAFAKDPSKTVEQYLAGNNVTAYVRVSVA